jgi:putative two-component system response regulator
MSGQDSSSQNSLATKLLAAQAQLQMYVKDLKMLLAREEKKSQQLYGTNRQLEAYAQDLKVAYVAEQKKTKELERAYADTLVRLALASRYKDEETGAHILRLSHYSKVLAQWVGLPSDETQRIFEAAPMHDVGKVGIPDAIMQKQGPLDASEWEVIKEHPRFGEKLLGGSSSPLMETARKIALTHHERWDGSGYPQGLVGEAIPLSGRIVMVADTYDALRSQRPYKPAYSHKKVCDIMLNGSSRTKPSHFDPSLLEGFRDLHQEFDEIFLLVVEDACLEFPLLGKGN